MKALGHREPIGKRTGTSLRLIGLALVGLWIHSLPFLVLGTAALGEVSPTLPCPEAGFSGHYTENLITGF